ncbi:glutathione S-transferase [Cupriavidus sp. TA19]|nr:glutathione S-transferase [Cupriavidus sp. TA19]
MDFVNRQHESPAYLELNPFGDLPILEDGSLRLHNAQAILTYVARKYDVFGIWYPSSASGASRIHQWLATASGELANLSRARLAKVFHYPFNLGDLHSSSRPALRVLDAHLQNRKWLELGRPTIADVACFPHVALANEAGISLSDFEYVSEWVERFKTIPGFIAMPGIASGS